VTDEPYLDEEDARRELFSWMVGRLADYPVRGRRLLEIGSNIGLFLSVAGSGGWKASGVEPSRWAVEQGVARYGVDLRQGTVEELEIHDGSVDALVMLDVLEHLSDPMEVLRKLRPSLDDEGLLALSTVNVDSLHARGRRGNWPWFIRSHLHYFRPTTLVQMLRAAGFEMVEWSVVPRTFHLSYLLDRAEGTFPGSHVARRVSGLVDPEIPVGWLGDVTLVIARPITDEPATR
jgi:SAM-dependent methyltransferase